MLHKISRKLRSNKAETLVESLVSVLIISITSIALAAMIWTASDLNKKTKEYDEKLDEAITAMLTTGTTKGEVKVKDAPFTVYIQKSGNDLKLYSYEKAPETASETEPSAST